MLSEAQIEQFRAQGYVKLDRLLDAAEVGGLTERLEDVLHGRVTWPKRCFQIIDPTLVRAPSGEPMPDGIQGPATQDERFLAVAEHPKLAAAMRDLMGTEVKRYTDQVILKTPGISPETFFHQDGFYWRATPDLTINCWIALDDAAVGNGCLRFMPGSQRGGLIEHESYFDVPSMHSGETGAQYQRLRIPLAQVEFAKEVAEPVAAGGCVFFLKYTWHRSDPNRSALQRRAYAIAYHEA